MGKIYKKFLDYFSFKSLANYKKAKKAILHNQNNLKIRQKKCPVGEFNKLEPKNDTTFSLNRSHFKTWKLAFLGS